MLNALTIDLEDWFQVSNLEHLIPYGSWGECPSRLAANTRRLLALLDRVGVRATFFVLGWNAARHPDLVREVKQAGHEIASHGYGHRLVYELTPESFAQDLAHAEAAIGEACGVSPRAYRAPSFSVTARSLWAFRVLAEAGYEMDSSVFPIYHERYGLQAAPRLPHRVSLDGRGCLLEAPPSTVRYLGRNFPFAGGAYFRLLPYPAARHFCRRLNRRGEPVVFYLHPWELDPEIPRFRLSPFRQLRTYANLDQTERRMELLLTDFRFGPLSEALAEWRQVDAISEWDPTTCCPQARGAGPQASSAVSALPGSGRLE